MILFAKRLQEEGLTETRALAIASAMKDLHAELCKLDKQSRARFFAISLNERMLQFASIEELNKLGLDAQPMNLMSQ